MKISRSLWPVDFGDRWFLLTPLYPLAIVGVLSTAYLLRTREAEWKWHTRVKIRAPKYIGNEAAVIRMNLIDIRA